MPDTPIGRLFGRITAEPDADFVAELEARLIAELRVPLDDNLFVGTPYPDEITLQPDRHDGPGLVIAAAPVRPRRIGKALLATAAAAIVFVVALVATSGRDHRVITSTPTTLEPSTTSEPTAPTTTEPRTTTPDTTATSAPTATTTAAVVIDPGFTQAMSTDLTSPGGSKLHFDGTVEFKIAVEANERSEDPNHNVLLLPKVSGTFTNIGPGVATIGETQVQIFMSGDFPCVQTADSCGPSLTIGSPDTAIIATLQPGETYTLDTASVVNRVNVPAGDVPYIIDEIAHGGKIVGTSVSVLFDSGDLQTTVFDRSGAAVLNCTALATDCMDANRSVLGADAAPVGSPALGQLAFPSGAAPAGTYAPARFIVPYTMTTGGPWQMVRDDSTATLLRRHDNAIVSAFQVGDGSTVGASTPVQALAALCAGDTTQDLVPKAATLFGQAAIQIEGVVTADCAIEQTLKYGDLRSDTFRAVATTVDGHVVYVIGIAPTNDWPTFGLEFDATVASLTLR